jgi:hypothetical protein
VFAAARLAIAFYPTDLIHSSESTRNGRIHLLLAAVAFVTICWAACTYPPTWLGYVGTTGAVGMFLGLGGVPWLQPVLGLFQRVFYAAIIAWFVVVAVRI